MELDDHIDSYTVNDEILFKLSQKIEIATGLNVTAKHASTDYQVSQSHHPLLGCFIHVDMSICLGHQLWTGRTL